MTIFHYFFLLNIKSEAVLKSTDNSLSKNGITFEIVTIDLWLDFLKIFNSEVNGIATNLTPKA